MKRFRKLDALKNVSFDIEQGDIYVLHESLAAGGGLGVTIFTY